MNGKQFRTPLKGALGLGSARQGMHHFVVQRITAAALFLLAPWFVWTVLRLLHLDAAGAHALVAQPCTAVFLLAFVFAVFWHAQLGLQVVIEDYVHTRGTQMALQIAVKFLCFLGGAACTLAILKIALGR